MKKICHITTVHPRYDVRIFYKECKSLSEFYNVSLIVADGKGDEINENIFISDVGLRQSSRFKRIKIDSVKAFQKAVELNCDLYHFHDPELIRIAMKLKKQGKKVIYDVHEDLPRQIYGKPYLNRFLKSVLSAIVEIIEKRAAKKFDYIVTATPFIRDRFLKINKNTVDINNFPILEENEKPPDFDKKNDELCYVGAISESRGVFEVIESLKYSKMKLNLAGKFESRIFEQKCRDLEGWKYVNYYGFVSRKEITDILNKSKIGMVTLHPAVNYLDSLPVKLFEYMLAGISVIASDFPLWKDIIETNKCGINVNPKNPEEIAKSALEIISNTELAEEMGQNGRKAVLGKYNWRIEETKLFDIYKQILN